ncbi:unnamed protein product, partial [Closterium sp. NIES-54]
CLCWELSKKGGGVRVAAYSQFLESYKSVTADTMARSFGVSLDFIDSCLCWELSKKGGGVRVVACSQFLESYKSATADAMARSFGVSLDFID